MSDNKCVTIMSVDADEMNCAVPIITRWFENPCLCGRPQSFAVYGQRG